MSRYTRRGRTEGRSVFALYSSHDHERPHPIETASWLGHAAKGEEWRVSALSPPMRTARSPLCRDSAARTCPRSRTPSCASPLNFRIASRRLHFGNKEASGADSRIPPARGRKPSIGHGMLTREECLYGRSTRQRHFFEMFPARGLNSSSPRTAADEQAHLKGHPGCCSSRALLWVSSRLGGASTVLVRR